MLLQALERHWPATAVHDTVRAVLRDPRFARSMRASLLDRALLWLGEAISKLFKLAGKMPSGRTIAIGVVSIVVISIVTRALVLAAAERGPQRRVKQGGEAAHGDPWTSAESLAAQGRFEEAAHALYRGVVGSLARTERIRLDPSRTSGDYARELRRRGSPALAPFRKFTRRFDVAVFGFGGCDASAIAELRELAMPFRERARAA